MFKTFSSLHLVRTSFRPDRVNESISANKAKQAVSMSQNWLEEGRCSIEGGVERVRERRLEQGSDLVVGEF